MILADAKVLTECDIRFLEYRLEVIGSWPPSARKHTAAEAISSRLQAIARRTPNQVGVDALLNISCRLLDDVYSQRQ